MKGVIVWVIVLASLIARTASAQAGPAAQALFEAGRVLMKSGAFADACIKFRESYRLERASGTRLNLALCEESLGNLARSWELFRALATALPSDDARLQLVRDHLAQLERRVPRVVLRSEPTLPRGASVEVAGMHVTRDGFDVPIPVDPGDHILWVETPGYLRRSYEIVIKEYQTVELAIAPGEPVLPAPPAALTSAVPRPPPAAADLGGKRRANSSAGVLRTGGIITLGAAAASLVASATLGVVAMRHALAMQALCHSDGSCTPDGIAAARSGGKLARAATAAFVVGITLGVSGSTFLVLSAAPGGAAASPPFRALGVSGGASF